VIFGHLIKEDGWQECFIWLPHKLQDGRWAWLERVERISYFHPSVPAEPCAFPFRYVFRALEHSSA
jgi:hypothetical protein